MMASKRTHLALRQRRCRLVHDHQPGVQREGARDGDQLLVGYGQRLDVRVEGNADLDPDQDVRGDRPDAAAVHQPAARGQLLAEGDVLGDR